MILPIGEREDNLVYAGCQGLPLYHDRVGDNRARQHSIQVQFERQDALPLSIQNGQTALWIDQRITRIAQVDQHLLVAVAEAGPDACRGDLLCERSLHYHLNGNDLLVNQVDLKLYIVARLRSVGGLLYHTLRDNATYVLPWSLTCRNIHRERNKLALAGGKRYLLYSKREPRADVVFDRVRARIDESRRLRSRGISRDETHRTGFIADVRDTQRVSCYFSSLRI